MEVGSQKSEVKKLTIFFRIKTIIKILIFNKLTLFTLSLRVLHVLRGVSHSKPILTCKLHKVVNYSLYFSKNRRWRLRNQARHWPAAHQTLPASWAKGV